MMVYLIGGLLLGWGLGANDSANIFGTAVYTKVIKYRNAVILTAIFVIIGALVDGQKGTHTIGEFAYNNGVETSSGALFVMLAAAFTVIIMTLLKLPISTSQSVIGALMGAGVFYGQADFSAASKFFGAWILTPLGGMVIAFGLYQLTRFWIEPRLTEFAFYETIVRLGYWIAGIFGAYSLGANNVANVTGVYTGQLDLITGQQAVIIGGLSIALGALTFSKPVMSTVGEKIVPMTPVAGFIVILSGALTVFAYAKIGIPVSTSQAVVGAIVGIGITSGIRTINVKMLRNIFIGWFATPTVAGVFSYIFLLLKLNVF